MARGINKLSARAVAAAKETGLYGDGGNLYLQVADVDDKGPTKSWVLRYMLGGRARKMGLGSLNDFSLAEARERARQARQQLADGVDPIEARLAERDARRRDEAERITFKDASAKYLAVHESGWRNAKHRQQWRSTLHSYAFPSLGHRPVKAIDALLVNGALADIWRKTPETASRVKQRIERVLRWVKDGMPLPAPSATRRVRHHPALPWAELPPFMAELRERDSISLGRWNSASSVRRGRRDDRRDVGRDRHRRQSVDRRRGQDESPPRTRVPLSNRAVEILRDLPREKGSPYVFPGGKAKQPLSNMAMLECVRGMRPGLTVHGFRSTFKDWCSESTNHPNIISEAALAHTIPDKVEKAYRRGDLLEKRRRLMRDWAAYCARTPADKLANVTVLRHANG